MRFKTDHIKINILKAIVKAEKLKLSTVTCSFFLIHPPNCSVSVCSSFTTSALLYRPKTHLISLLSHRFHSVFPQIGSSCSGCCPVQLQFPCCSVQPLTHLVLCVHNPLPKQFKLRPFYFGAFTVSIISSSFLSRDKKCP